MDLPTAAPDDPPSLNHPTDFTLLQNANINYLNALLPDQSSAPHSPNIFCSQRNIAIKCIVNALGRNILPRVRGHAEGETLTKVNVLFVGPSYIELREQTTTDLENYIRFNLISSFLREHRHIVINSSSLTDTFPPALAFLDRVRTTPLDLHYVVLDEADWGVRVDSNINKFLQQLADIVNQVPNIRLLLLVVSATMEVLTKISRSQNGYGQESVNWKLLRTQNQDIFGVPTYLPIERLKYEYVPTKEKKVAIRAQLISEEYENAFRGISSAPTKAAEVLNALINSDRPISAVLRLGTECNTLWTKLTKIAKDNKFPFEVLLLSQNSEQLEKQLSQKALDSIEKNPIRIADCKRFSFLLLVDKLLERGQRLTNTCRFYDVRARYNDEIEQLSTFVQDVGRCAGYQKEPATVFYGINLPAIGLEHIENNAVKFHALLSKATGMLSGHPNKSDGEERKNVFERLRRNMVILDAEPQIGKTGVILSILGLLHEMYFYPVPQVLVPVLQQPQQKKSELVIRTKKLYDDCKVRRGSLAEKFSDDSAFWDYHVLMSAANEAWGEKSPSYIAALAVYNKFFDYGDIIFICDAGCGALLNFEQSLEKLNKQGDLSFEIVAIDVGLVAPEMLNSNNLKIISYQMDVLDYDKKLDFHVITFNLAFFVDDITAEIDWAYNHLRKGGMLLIAEVTRRFTPTFIEDVEKRGFKGQRPPQYDFSMFTFYKSNVAPQLEGQVVLHPLY